MKVSVCMITYNHEKFISQAIESVLMQKTDFEYELVIGEDYSTDSTREIVKQYAERYPDRIKVLLHPKNLGIQTNFTETLKACNGEYIALLEGDDYWTDKYKLQKQVDFLDEQPECAICFHNVKMIYDNNPEMSHPFYSQNPNGRPFTHKKPNPISTLKDLLNLKGNFIHTPSVMFRSRLFEELPGWYYKVPMGDWPLHILNAHHGDVGYIDEVLGVYRVHAGGIWSSKSRVNILNASIQAANLIKQCLSLENSRIIENTIERWHLETIEILLREKDLKAASLYARKCLLRVGFDKKYMLIKLILEGYFPGLYKILVFFKNHMITMPCSLSAIVKKKDNSVKHYRITKEDRR